MTLQTFVPYMPFLAVLFVLFALLQALRHRRQGFGAALLALVSIAAPLAAYLLSSDVSLRASLIQSMTINAAVVFVASLLTLLIERRDPKRDPNHSYGLLGIGLSMLLVVGMFALPMIAATSATNSTTAAFNTAANTGDTVLVSAVTPGAAISQSSDTTVQPQATPAAPPNGNFAPPLDGSGSFAPPSDMLNAANAQPPATAAASQDTASPPVVLATNTPESQSAAPSIQAGDTPATTGESIIRPTRIVFPTETPAPEATAISTVAADTASASAGSDSTAAACTLVVDYNLNLRDQPTTDGSTVLLSIPFGSSVSSSGHTADGWYSVTYDGKSGWISGQYVTAGAACASLPVLKVS